MMVLKNADLFNGKDERIEQNVSIFIEDGRIVDILKDPQVALQEKPEREIDTKGLTALPGLINVHVHLCLDPDVEWIESEREELRMTLVKMVRNARATLEAGITTIRDLGCKDHLDFILKEAVERGIVPGPRMLVSGKVITKTGGHGHFIGREADGQIEIIKAVREQVKAGADVVKVMATGGVMTEGVEPGLALYSFEEVMAAAEEARRSRKMTASHAQGAEGIRNAVLAGIDSIEHGIFLTEEIADLMVERGTYWVPTLSPGERLSDPRAQDMMPEYALEKAKRVFPVHRENFAKFSKKENLNLGIGSDAGVPLVPHTDIVTEMEVFKQFGFSNFEVLRMATYGNAKLLRLGEEIGSIEVGKMADLILVDGDPLQELSVLRKPKLVMKKGEIYRE